MIDISKLRIGDKVSLSKVEDRGNGHLNGAVKSIQDLTHVFVVFNCGGDWINFKNYTAVRCKASQLNIGWKH